MRFYAAAEIFSQKECVSTEIKRLDRQKYDHFVLEYNYDADYIYDVSAQSSKECMGIKFERRKLEKTRHFSNSDTLFQEYWQSPEAYGIFDAEDRLCAVTELDFEEWNNRMRITQLLVYEAYRGKGLGKKLMEFAKSTALERDYRMIIAETQSNNTRAVDFYLSQGFVFSGTNIHFYSNDDISENEVMLELAYLF